jgi:hypothetical protein
MQVQAENNYAFTANSVMTRMYATNKTLKEAIALFKEYDALMVSRAITQVTQRTLLSVSEIEELSVEEMKYMGIILIEGILEATKNHKVMQ